ncbi:hypothetical protein HHI36_011072 [Cryptolaemus montrouzieri]|uniref:Uncharacterized protein n=1 Tax=Cryptolaemus montrouzieri TaxID=559131 RepID=A0ABD2MKY7_9CUCU
MLHGSKGEKLKNLRDEIVEVMENKSPSANKTEKGRRSRTTIIGDEIARNIRSVLRKLLDEDRFSITASIKSNIEAAYMTHDLFGAVSDYGPKDYVIFMFGKNYVSNKRTLNICLHTLLPIGRFTNLITIVGKKSIEDYRIIRDIQGGVTIFCRRNFNSSIVYLVDEEIGDIA